MPESSGYFPCMQGYTLFSSVLRPSHQEPQGPRRRAGRACSLEAQHQAWPPAPAVPGGGARVQLRTWAAAGLRERRLLPAPEAQGTEPGLPS